jgi:hypothetical protein
VALIVKNICGPALQNEMRGLGSNDLQKDVPRYASD